MAARPREKSLIAGRSEQLLLLILGFPAFSLDRGHAFGPGARRAAPLGLATGFLACTGLNADLMKN